MTYYLLLACRRSSAASSLAMRSEALAHSFMRTAGARLMRRCGDSSRPDALASTVRLRANRIASAPCPLDFANFRGDCVGVLVRFLRTGSGLPCVVDCAKAPLPNYERSGTFAPHEELDKRHQCVNSLCLVRPRESV